MYYEKNTHTQGKLYMPFRHFMAGHKKPFGANQNDVVKHFAVVMSAVIKRVDCSLI